MIIGKAAVTQPLRKPDSCPAPRHRVVNRLSPECQNGLYPPRGAVQAGRSTDDPS